MTCSSPSLTDTPLAAVSPGLSAPATRATPAGVVLLLVVLVGLGLRYAVINPTRNYLLDFRAFYVAGRALHEGVNPYDQEVLQRTIHASLPGGQELVGYAYPPATLFLMYVFAALPLDAAQVAWSLFQMALVLGGILLVLRAINVEFGSPVAVLVVAVFWLSDALASLFRWGQFDGLRLGMLGLAFYALARGRAVAAGVAIGVAAVAKVYPVAYLWVFALRREWRAFIAGCVTIAALMALGLAALTPEARARYVNNNRRQLDTLDYVIPARNMSLAGFIHRAFVQNDSVREPSDAWVDLGPDVAGWLSRGAAAAVLVVSSVWVVRQRRTLSTGESLAVFVPAILLAEVIAWPHHCVEMFVPLLLLACVVARQDRGRVAHWVGVALALSLFAFCPVHQFELSLPKRVEHLVGPTMTYALVLTWVFMLARYPRLKRNLRGETARSVRLGAASGGPELPRGTP